MGAPQFGRGIENKSFAENVEVDIKKNEANQFDDDFQNGDISTYDSGEQNISGAQELTVAVNENSGSGDANLEIRWTNGSGNTIFTENPDDLQNHNGSGNWENIIVKSTHVQIVGTGSSTDSNVTVNAH